MARKLGPKHKLCRRVGERLCSTDKCPITRRAYPPGMHGNSKMRIKLTPFGIQLREKQKAKAVYGLLERQFKNYVLRAMKSKGNTAETILAMLEKRLDNVVFRAGFTKTRAAARQLINHGHFLINGKKVNIPSFEVRIGDLVSPKSASLTGPFKGLAEALEKYEAPSWLLVNKTNFEVKILETPKSEELQPMFDSKMIVEFYSR